MGGKGMTICERHGRLRCGECAYVEELKEEIKSLQQQVTRLQQENERLRKERNKLIEGISALGRILSEVKKDDD